MNFLEVDNLKYSLYLLYRRDSWLWDLKKTENGREFLKNIWRLQQTKADLNSIHNFQNRGGDE